MQRAALRTLFHKEARTGVRGQIHAEIVKEMFSYSDAAHERKEDGIVNIGGFLAVNDEDLYKRHRTCCSVEECELRWE